MVCASSSGKSMKSSRVFSISAGAILLIASACKIVSAFQDRPYFHETDALFYFLNNRQLLFGEALIEMAIGLPVCFSRNIDQKTKLKLILWLSSLFIFYRLAVWWLGFAGPCRCLGNAVDWIGVRPQTLDVIMRILLAYLLGGSALFQGLGWLAIQKDKNDCK
jgi:hypothetical protein